LHLLNGPGSLGGLDMNYICSYIPNLHRHRIPTPLNLDFLVQTIAQAIYCRQETENGWIFVACRAFAPKGTMIYHRKKGEGAEGGSVVYETPVV